MNTQPTPWWITRQTRTTQSPRPFQSSLSTGLFFLSPFSSGAFVRYKPSSFFPPSCSTHLPAMNHYRMFLFINVYHLSFTIPIHIF
ncbi:hypothetical protein ACN42_g3220 [Penicillium freii]|uniref:Uncharacterized protein n=1 Tax=Penicillium freii TaxID=48697 RepID=A0A101MNM6_PENFR|nr:hypothetical protein ACN42_g3220 [Penicillium freii]